MAEGWKSVLQQRPEDGKKCWCRVSTFYTTPVILIWHAAEQVFKDADTEELTIPWYYVVRWKPFT